MRFLKTNILLLLFIVPASTMHADCGSTPLSWGQRLYKGIDACSINFPIGRLFLNSVRCISSELKTNPWKVIGISLAAGLVCNYGYKIVEKWWNKQCELSSNIIASITLHYKLHACGGVPHHEITQVKKWTEKYRTLFLRKNYQLINAVNKFYNAKTVTKRDKYYAKIKNYASGKFNK